ncbi:MAG: sensor histidine kinase [Planctomycetes bacterium]|nr:sensor histidine kinase [Planctomycetota bacterium]
MIRRISTKWMISVLAAVLVPFLGFAWFADTQMANRHLDTVRYYLLTMAGEAAERVDNELRERERDIEMWTTQSPFTQWTITGGRDEENSFRALLGNSFDRFVKGSNGVYDLIMAINAKGELIVSNRCDFHGDALTPAVLAALDRDYSQEAWFQTAMSGHMALVDHHLSPLLPPRVQTNTPHPENFHIGFAMPVSDHLEPDKAAGVVFALMNWAPIQNLVTRKERPRAPSVAPDIYSTSYVWLWGSDCDTILAHPKPGLYGKKVSEPGVDLPELVAAAKKSDWDLYPEYYFKGVWKNAAFKHCVGPDQNGFGWVVGVGIDNDDIYETARELRLVLWVATALVLSLVVCVTMLVARRTTRPILALKSQTQRLASGDLDARVTDLTDDELGELGRSFNDMAAELKDSRNQIIKAEKDAAWREMARQVAHEIKNPLTPIQLAANLLKRAKDEGSPEFDTIFDNTIAMIDRQVVGMRKIAADFSAFAGARKPEPTVFELRAVLEDVVAMHAAWLQEAGVTLEKHWIDGQVFVDRDELSRVLINLVANAIEAMPGGGKLTLAISRRPERTGSSLIVEVKDTGAGLSDTVRARLFEPYFTTRTHGTGLGLAIAKRLVEEMNGTITLEPRPAGEGVGTIARIVLPERGAPTP